MKRLAFAAIALLAASGALADTAQSSRAPEDDTVWDAAMEAFAAEDHEHAPPPGGIVFVGSSSIRLWKGLEHQFRDEPVIIKRGFGGSRLSDCVHYLDRLVIRYNPSMVLVYAGDNDLAEGRTPEQVLQEFEAFAHGVHQALPTTRIAFISVKPSPARAALIPNMRKTNSLVRQYTTGKPWLDFIDVFTPMTDPEGAPRSELFQPDALHLNDLGYALWKEAIKPHLR